MTPDERFAEKLRARAEGRAPVIVTAPALPRGNSPEAVEARFKAKLARHGKPEPKGDGKPSAEPKPGAKSDGKGEQAQSSKPQPEPEPKGDGKPSAEPKPGAKSDGKGEQAQSSKPQPEPEPKGDGKSKRG